MFTISNSKNNTAAGCVDMSWSCAYCRQFSVSFNPLWPCNCILTRVFFCFSDLCGSKMLPFLNNNARNGLNGLNGLNSVNGLQGVNGMNGAGRPAVGGRPRALSPPGSLFSDLSAMMHLGQKPAAPPAPAPARPDSLKDWQGLQKHFPNINFSFGTPGQSQLPPPPPQQAVPGGRFSVPSRHAPAHTPAGVSPNMQRYMSQPPKTTAAGQYPARRPAGQTQIGRAGALFAAHVTFAVLLSKCRETPK